MRELFLMAFAFSIKYEGGSSAKGRKQERSGEDVRILRGEVKLYHFEEWESKFNAEVVLLGKDECSGEAYDHKYFK